MEPRIFNLKLKEEEKQMAKILYKIVEHNDGWAYQVENTYSETFVTHEEARAAAMMAAREQAQPGKDVGITFEDANGNWHEELSDGEDRPEARVEG
jgi:Uncharacterized protein conserved in bacteria (DUF2188)